MRKRSTAFLLALLLCVWGGYGLLRASGWRQNAWYAVKVDAATRMRACLDALYAEKNIRGIAVNEAEDRNRSGVIGEAFTPMTTTLGSLEAKRTAATPDAAAMLVQMFAELGLAPGDRVAVNMSGSFPGLNLAVCCAMEAMDLQAVCIASAGASSYGANQLDFTYVDMHSHLVTGGWIHVPLAAASVGGTDDVGRDMWDQGAPEAIRAAIARAGIPRIDEPDLACNLLRRMEIYQQDGPIAAFVNIGGNWVSGAGGETVLPTGVLRAEATDPSAWPDGLIRRFLEEGVPVLHLLNLKSLSIAYGLPFDPNPVPRIGVAAVYR